MFQQKFSCPFSKSISSSYYCNILSHYFFTKTLKINTKIAFHNLFNLTIFCGQVASLYSHSNPIALQNLGALFWNPVK